MRKISSIDRLGKILFEDAKGTGTTAGTKDDCLAYGYDFDGTNCYVSKSRIPKDSEINLNGNFVAGEYNCSIGSKNIIKGSHSKIFGNGNVIDRRAKNSITLGMGSFTEKFGEISLGSSINRNRGKYSVVQYNGRTTDASATELFLCGKLPERFYINEDYNGAFHIDVYAVCYNKTDGQAVLRSKLALYKYVSGTLTEIFDTDYVNAGDSGMSAVALAIAPVSGTPDYVEVKVTGIASKTIDYNVVVKINEVRDYES